MSLEEMRARRAYALVLAAIASAPGICPGAALAQPSPPVAAFASAIVPGLGQATYGNYEEALAHFGIFALSLSAAVYYQREPDLLDDGVRYDSENDREYVNQTTLRRDFALRLAVDTALYSSFSAYRDARQRDDRAYRTPAPKESLADLALAPFSWEFLSRPTTFIPLAFQAWAVSRSNYGYGIYRGPDVSTRDLHLYNITANEFTAVGEEGFFRGFINNEFSDRWGNGWGLTWSSLLFGIAHTGQGQTANAVEASIAGAYLGWMQQRNGFGIGEGVALHYWINVLAGIAAIRNGGSAPLLSLRVPF
jgi:membrane protease YdiL (CAAX protease family)